MALKLGTIIFIVWLAWTIRPLMEEKHSVQFHEKQLSPDFLRNEQGLWLHSSSCFPPSSPSGSPSSAIKGVIFYAHGLAEYCGRYHEFATLWNNHSFAFFCLDHQGHGRSEGERAYVEDFDHYVRDYLRFADFVLQRYPHLNNLPRFLVGTSMGGAISVLVANSRPSFFDGVVLLAPAIIPDPRAVSPWQIAAARLFSAYLPKLRIGALNQDRIFTDPDMQISFNADPLAFKGGLAARWGSQMLTAMEKIQEQASTRTTYPFFIVYGTDDETTSMAGAEWLIQNAKNSKDKEFKLYEGWRHALMHEPNRQILFTDLAEWVLARI